MPVERATSPMKMMAGLNRAPYLIVKINVRSPEKSTPKSHVGRRDSTCCGRSDIR